MNREDIIRMARSAIRLAAEDTDLTNFDQEATILDRYQFLYWFAKEVTTAERERIAAEWDGHRNRREMMNDPVNHPKHYTSHPSGIECIQITEHMGFNLGNALKYIWRADLKNDAVEDLRKARWYIEREITKRIGTKPPSEPHGY